MILNKHNMIVKMLYKKIIELKEDSSKHKSNNGEIEKFETLYKLITNQFYQFFGNLNIDMAYAILQDIGIPQEDLRATYLGLLNEEREEKKYILIDLNEEEIKDK